MSSAQSQSAFNFDAKASRTARDRGIERVTSKANPDWLREMIAVGVQVARVKQEFSTDDIVLEYSKDPSRPVTDSSPRAMTAVVFQLRKMKIAEMTDRYINSIKTTSHKGPIRVYRSLIHRNSVS